MSSFFQQAVQLLLSVVSLLIALSTPSRLVADPLFLTDGSVTAQPFGKLPSGQTVTLYTLTNAVETSVSIMDFGATVVKLMTPDRTGKFADICLGFDTFSPYPTLSPYFGATIGRFGNRIAKGTFTLEKKTYQLAINNGPNSLHGGLKGFDKQMWKAEVLSKRPATIRFSRLSPDGEEGYPGDLQVSVTLRLTNQNRLSLNYEATTNKTTIINLTNHTYFDLNGDGQGNILNHLLTIRASHYTPVDATLIPTGEIKPVAGTPFDFRKSTAIGLRLKQTGGSPAGYDHNFVLDGENPDVALAEVHEPTTGRWLEIYSDQPGLQFYSGNFLDGKVKGKAGNAYRQYNAFCLETQHFPDSPNHPNFPSVVLYPGQPYRTQTTYVFGAK